MWPFIHTQHFFHADFLFAWMKKTEMNERKNPIGWFFFATWQITKIQFKPRNCGFSVKNLQFFLLAFKSSIEWIYYYELISFSMIVYSLTLLNRHTGAFIHIQMCVSLNIRQNVRNSLSESWTCVSVCSTVEESISLSLNTH